MASHSIKQKKKKNQNKKKTKTQQYSHKKGCRRQEIVALDQRETDAG